MKIYLRPNERLFLNGAVIRTDRKVSLELLNDATFLLENHVMQQEEATTPLRQLYYVVQLMLMDPVITHEAMTVFKDMISNLLENLENRKLIEGVKEVDVAVSQGKVFPSLKTIRTLYKLEDEILGADSVSSASIAGKVAQEAVSLNGK